MLLAAVIWSIGFLFTIGVGESHKQFEGMRVFDCAILILSLIVMWPFFLGATVGDMLKTLRFG